MKALSTVLSFLALVTFSQAAQALKRVKLDERAANGACLVRPVESPAAILQRNDIEVVRENGHSLEAPIRQALSVVLGTIESLGAGEFDAQKDVQFLFGDLPGFSYHVSGTKVIHINPGAENIAKLEDKNFGGVHNVGMLTHELAHFIALRDRFRIQRAYESEVSDSCYLTDYTHANRYEEFAEVFAAFVTNPTLLQNQGDACQDARKFMAGLFQESLKKSESCESRLASVQLLRTKLSER